jgi:hypothetical protein
MTEQQQDDGHDSTTRKIRENFGFDKEDIKKSLKVEWFEPSETPNRDLTDEDGNKYCCQCGYTGKASSKGNGTYCPECGFNLNIWPWECPGCEVIQSPTRNGFKWKGERYCDQDCAEEHA